MEIIDLISEGNIRRLREKLESGNYDVKHRDKKGLTYLHHAARAGFVDIIKEVASHCIGAGLSVDVRDVAEKWTPLFYAIYNSDDGSPEICGFLVEKGADVNLKDKKGRTPLHYAAHNGQDLAVEFLLRKKAKIDAADKEGLTALHLAVMEGQLSIVQYLVEHGCDINVVDENNENILHHAVVSKGANWNYIEYLVKKGCNINKVNDHGDTPLLKILRSKKKIKKEKIVKTLLNLEADTQVVNNYGDCFETLRQTLSLNLTGEEEDDDQNEEDDDSEEELLEPDEDEADKFETPAQKKWKQFLLVVYFVLPIVLIIVAKVYEKELSRWQKFSED